VSEECPLCRDRRSTLLLQFAYDEVWQRLRADLAVELSPAVRSCAEEDGERCSLVRCGGCGLERFAPLVPGGEAFYAELMEQIPYNAGRWDFDRVRSMVGVNDAVADLGGGEGLFLESLGERSARSVAVDHNAAAIERFIDKGGEGYVLGFDSFAQREESHFDVVTSFHTLEHVADPVGIGEAAARCLRSGGRAFISVPNRDRSWREEGEPLDRPPHHVTRWAGDQLYRLASLVGLQVEGLSFEPPDISVARALIAVERGFGRSRSRIRNLAGRTWSIASLSSSEHARRVRDGSYVREGIVGQSMMIQMRKA
jgi:SAM-dependent methyltransferase